MKRLIIAGIVLALAACKVEKTGQDTYKVVAPTPEAKKAGAEAKAQAKVAGEKLKEEAARLGEKIKTETQHTETTSTTSTTSTSSDGTATTVTKTSTHH